MNSKTRPWSHQINAYNAAINRENYGLFMDMGTGKTKVAVDIMVNRGHKTILIVCPKSVLVDDLWTREILTHGNFGYGNNPTIVPLTKGTAKNKAKIIHFWRSKRALSDVMIMIINYDSVWRKPLSDVILKYSWDCVILDEAHRIKAPGSRVSRFFARLSRKAKQRLALTGTPMPNSPLDLYGIFRFLDPRVFGTNFARFRGRYAIMGGYQNYQVIAYKNQEHLMQELGAHSFRVKLEEVLDMPPIVHSYRVGELNSEAYKIYRQLDKEMIATIGESVTVTDNILTKILRLRQLVSGIACIDSGESVVVSTDKENLFRGVMEDLGTIPVVIFCNFIHEEKSIRKVLSERGVSCSEITGVGNTFLDWKEGKTQALLVQINSGSEGLSMVRANHAIYYSKPFSLGVYQQSIARLRRPGQTSDTVCLIHLQLERTIDIKIDHALRDKKKVVDYILKVYNTTS